MLSPQSYTPPLLFLTWQIRFSSTIIFMVLLIAMAVDQSVGFRSIPPPENKAQKGGFTRKQFPMFKLIILWMHMVSLHAVNHLPTCRPNFSPMGLT